MSHNIRINARHSDLARLQAYRVGDALKAAHPNLTVTYSFRASLGDQNVSDPLWKMPEKGVFTEDFVRDLHEGTADLVVHSWKDLPTDPRPGLEIAATLPRADQRDLFLCKREWSSGALRVLTSSPRRAYNLDPFFREYVPGGVTDVVFENVRGNIPTRLRKLLEGDAHGLIVAKAAIDRLLEAPEPEFEEARAVIRRALQATRVMVLPLSLNPTAAAQGALAVEILSSRRDLHELLKSIHSPETFAAVTREREILSSYGGGCHQKIGVSIQDRPYGRITYLRGLTDAGQVLSEAALTTTLEMPRAESAARVFPVAGLESPFFKRSTLPRGIWSKAEQAACLFVARETAWPEGFRCSPNALVVTAGLKTWKRLSEKGVWVSGSVESLGEADLSALTTLSRAYAGESPRWVKLTHESAAASGVVKPDVAPVATYALTESSEPPSLKTFTHFYWMSTTAFDRARALYPEILELGVHASGPGHTHDHLLHHLPRGKTPFVYLNVEQFRRAALS